MTPSPKRAYSYIRFSKATQESGDSIRRQTAFTQQYCKQHGLILDDSLKLEDRGVSAYRGKNVKEGALARFINACESGLVPMGSALILESLDRLSRQSPRRTVTLLSTLLDTFGLEVHLTMVGKVFRPDAKEDEGLDLIFAVAMAMRAHDESETKSKRLLEAFAQKRKRAAEGTAIVSKSLPWYLVLRGSKIVCPSDRAALVKRIFQLTIKGHSSNSVARLLNEKRTPTWRPTQKLWSAARVRDLIRSDAPLGILRETPKTAMGGRTHEILNYYPQIISAETAVEARAVLKRNTRGNRGRPQSNPDRPSNLLRGLLSYQNHWCSLAVHRNGPTDPDTGIRQFNAYYQCHQELEGKTLFSMAANQVEGVLLLGLQELTAEDLCPAPAETTVPQSVLIKKRIDALDAKISNLLAAIEAGSASVATRLRSLEIEREELAVKLEEAKASEATPSASPQSLAAIKGISLDHLKDRNSRDLIATHLRRLIIRIEIGRTLTDLSLSKKFLGSWAKSIVCDGTSPIPDTTSKLRPRKPLALLVHFGGGASRLIVRGIPQPDTIYSHRAEVG
jgi:DNA invertase Pin-like site-specific DNA recombinase